MSSAINENAVKDAFGESSNLWSEFKLRLLELFAKKVDIDGGTMEGSLILNGDPKDPKEAVTKQYADNNIKILTTIRNGLCGTVPGWIPSLDGKSGSASKYIPIVYTGFSNQNYPTECIKIMRYNEDIKVFNGTKLKEDVYVRIESANGNVYITSGESELHIDCIIFFPAETF